MDVVDQVMLYDSTFCRLCAEENENGILLFGADENEEDLSQIINRYLPLKVKNDGKFPRSICPGCNIQLDAMVQFLQLIISGQEKIRELWKQQQDQLRRNEKNKQLLEQNGFGSEHEPFTIQAIEENGKEIFIQIMPDGSLYSTNHEMNLKMAGLERPRRKRGRPPKPPPGTVSEATPKDEPEPEPEETELDDDADGRKRRRRKVPERFREAVQGKELERIFREEGVIDAEETSESEEQISPEDSKSICAPFLQEAGDEIIGHLENKDGQDLGELVIINNRKSRFKAKSRRRRNFVCEICNRGFIHYGRYLIHKTYHKCVEYECGECGMRFATKDGLAGHQTEVGHSGEGIVETLDREVDTDTNEQPEILQPTTIATTSECEQSIADLPSPASAALATASATQLLTHKFACEQCDKSFQSKQSYDVHVKAKHEGQKPFQCDKCDKTFAYQASLKGHLTTHTTTPPKSYPCTTCPKTFNHPSSVVYHRESEHNNGRRFVCNKCSKSFKHKQLLQRHQLVHTEDRPFVCKSCGATFKTRANLLNHQPTHTGVKKYFCQQCGQLFAHKTSLTLHYRWHSGQKPYECGVCNKAFSQKGNLQEHKRIHTGEKPYSCQICTRKFTTSSQYKLHVKRHTGERPWRCEYCTKTFLHKDTWKCHVRRHRNERPYQCPSCFRDFAEQWALKKHMRLHTGERPYVCEVCNKAFADCSNLTKHKRVHRGGGVGGVKEMKEMVDVGVAVQSVNTEDGNVIYVYQDPNDGTDLPALVQILEDSVNVNSVNVNETAVVSAVARAPLNNVNQTTTADDDDDDDQLARAASLMQRNEDQSVAAAELRLEDFDGSGNLPITAGQLHVTDEDGNPIYFTAQNGQQIRVTSFDGQNLQVCLDDGSLLPIQIHPETGKAIASGVATTTTNMADSKQFKIDDQIVISQLSSSGTDTIGACAVKSEVVQNLLDDESVQFMTEDGQNVCLVTAYNIDSDQIHSAYLPIT